MRVLLIRPNSRWRHTYYPVGIGYVADAIRKAGHEVAILDARLKGLSARRTIDYVRHMNPEVIGLSAIHMALDIEGTRLLCRALKEYEKNPSVLLGGPVASTLGKNFVEGRLVDVAIMGEGEDAFCKYLDAKEKGYGLSEVPSIIYSQNGEIRQNQPGPYLDDLDERMPAWDLNKPEQYFSTLKRSNMNLLARSRRVMPVFTSRGCPFGCIYCHNVFGRKFRPRSVESVLEEMMVLKKDYGVEEIDIVDDCFNLDLDRAKAIARGMIEKKLNLALAFPNALRVDRMDRELVDLLHEAGTHHIRYAIETASPRLQKLIHKNLDIDKAEPIITYTADKRILTIGYFMLGFPTETDEEMSSTVEYALRSKFHAAYFFYATPFPGTPMAEQYLPATSLDSEIESAGYFNLRVNMSEVSDQFLRNVIKKAYRKFYFSPRRMFRTATVAPKNIQTVLAIIIVGLLSIRERVENW